MEDFSANVQKTSDSFTQTDDETVEALDHSEKGWQGPDGGRDIRRDAAAGHRPGSGGVRAARARPVGAALPRSWWHLDLDPSTRDANTRRSTEEQAQRVTRFSRERLDGLIRTTRRTAREAYAQGALRAAGVVRFPEGKRRDARKSPGDRKSPGPCPFVPRLRDQRPEWPLP